MIGAVLGLGVLAFFLVILGFVFYGLVIWPFFSKPKAVHEPWAERVAARLNGRYTLTEDRGNPWIRFDLCGRPAQFWSGWEEDHGTTRIEIDVRGVSPGALLIFPKVLGRGPRMQDSALGDAAFDADYGVQATPADLVRRLFRAERRAVLIGAVRRLEVLGPPFIELEGERLDVGVRKELSGEAAYLELAGAARDFVSAFGELLPKPSILWGALQSGGSARCLVCATLLERDVVRCKKCRTPHHDDCWRYARRCATYGCGERRWVRA